MSMKASLLAFCVAGSSLAVSSEEVLKLSFNTSSVVSESEYPELFSRWPLRSAVNPSPHPPVIALSQGSGFELFRGKRWQVARRFPSGSLSIGYRSRTDAGFTELRLAGEWLARSYPMLILEGAAAELWLAVYDVVANSPSGRRLDRVANGVTIYRLLPDGLGTVKRLADGLDLGGFDTHLYGSLGPARLHVCGANRCYSIGDGGYRQDWELAPLSSFEFVEVAIRGTQAVAILRRKHDDRFDGEPGSSFSEYFIAEFTHTGNVRIVPVARGIPWRLRFGPFGARYSLASTPGDLRRLFYHDLNRLTHEGSKDLATNNLEGRIAWSQFYYLNAMVSLFNPQLEWLLPDNRNALRARLQSELALLTQFCQDGYPGLLVRRYSYNREPLLIALHLGRVAQLLKRAESFESAGSSRDCRHWLNDRLTQLDTTLEETYATTTDDGRPGTYVRFRRGEDFWADGVNVPYNYVSAIAGGLISLDAGNRRAAAEYMSFLVDNEFSAKRPRSWRYWWGIGDAGWSVEDGSSRNPRLTRAMQGRWRISRIVQWMRQPWRRLPTNCLTPFQGTLCSIFVS